MRRKRKVTGRILSVLLCAGLTLSHVPVTVSAASEEVAIASNQVTRDEDVVTGDITYIDGYWDGETRTVVSETKSVKESQYTQVTSSTTVMSSGWYVVSGEVTVDSRITVKGEVHLILLDDSCFIASKGISVVRENTLSIYAQSTGSHMGELIAEGNYYDTAIGGDANFYCGSITIQGGKITADSGDNAGIGGGWEYNYGYEQEDVINGGIITINGGIVSATAFNWGSGISCGLGAKGSSIIINGGTVSAMSLSSGAGIGSGGENGTITINGGTVSAVSKYYGAGIGGGEGLSGGNITILGGNITAVKGEDAPNDIGSGHENIEGGDAIVEGSLMIKEGNVITVSGAHTLPMDYTIPEDVTLVILEGASLTVPEGVTLINKGIVDCRGHVYSTGCDKTCNFCEDVREEGLEHAYENGVCTVCADACDNELNYTVDGNVIAAHCTGGDAHGSISLQAPETLVYGTVGACTVEGEIIGVDIPSIVYATEDGEILSQAPMDRGTYTASITMGTGEEAVTAKVTYTIDKGIPAAELFEFNPPTDLTYDGQGKSFSVTTKDGVTGMGEITTACYKVEEDTEELVRGIPTKAGTYRVEICVAEGTNYNATEHAVSDASWTFEIGKATPQMIQIPTAEERTYHPGRTLSDVELTGGEASVEGFWNWKEESKVPTVGNEGYVAVFTPVDAQNYAVVEKTILVNVTPATPYIKTTPTTGTITEGEKLSKVTLSGGVVQYNNVNDTAVEGTFSWKDGEIKPSVSDSGKTGYTVVFTPADKINYRTVEFYLPVTVGKGLDVPSLPQETRQPSGNKETTQAPIAHQVGSLHKDDSGKAVYKVTKSHLTKGTVTYMKPVNKKVKTVSVPTTATIGGVTYKVTAIGKNAFKGNRYIKKVTIGSNVNSIGAKAFYRCKKLKQVIVKTKKLKAKKVGKKAFVGIKANATIKVPKKNYRTYKALLRKRGAAKRVTFKKC